MAEKNFNLFVDKYETIRKMLRQIFTFGCYDRIQGAEFQKISERKYSKEIKRILNFFPNKIARDRNFEGKQINHFPFSRYSGDKNYLWLSYCIKSFSPQDLNLYIAILKILNYSDFQNVTYIREKILMDVIGGNVMEADIFDPMLRNRLRDMAEIGILERKKNKYRLSKNILSKFTSAELLKIYNLLEFYRDTFPISSIGYILQWLIREYIKNWRNEKNFEIFPIFGVEDFFLQNILNDEIFYKLIVAIEQRNFIKVQFFYNDEKFLIVPLKIILDRQYGKQYLFFADSTKMAFIRRLDDIINFEIVEDKFFNRSDFVETEKILENVWCSELNSSCEETQKILVEIDFNIEENFIYEEEIFKEIQRKSKPERIFNRLECEKHIGQIEKLTEKHRLFSVEVINHLELVSFILSFGKYAKVRPSNFHNLAEIIEKHYKNLKLAYTDLNAWKNLNIFDKIFDEKSESLPVSNNKPKFFCEYRNKFFVAIQEIYNSIMNHEKNYTQSKFINALCRKTFVGNSIKNIAAKISEYGGQTTQFSLFQNIDDEIILSSQSENNCNDELPLLMITPEKRWLRTLLNYPVFSKLIGEKLREKLLKLLDVKPFPLQEIIIERNFWNEPVDSEKLLTNLKIIFDTICDKKFLKYVNCAANGNEFSGVCCPQKIIYSPYMHKYYLDAVILNDNGNDFKRMIVANLKNLEPINPTEKIQVPFKDLQQNSRYKEKLKLLIKSVSGYRDIENCFMLFSTHEKSGWYDELQNIYHMEISFYSFEIPAITRKILSLGATVVVEEPTFIRDFILFKTGINN